MKPLRPEDYPVELGVTVSAPVDPVLVARARESAERWRLPYIDRPRRGAIEPLLGEQAHALLVLGTDGWTLKDPEGALRFAPTTAWLRIKRIDAGEQDDVLAGLCELKAGDQVLDCTLGLGADALVCARVVGPSGRVVGIEKSLPLWVLATEGMAHSEKGARSARIETLHGDSAELIATFDDQSFDCVLFDPAFEKPKKSSPAFEILRRTTTDAPLTEDLLRHARRVARRWVVVKSASYTPAMKRMGLQPEPASRFSNIIWARVRGGK